MKKLMILSLATLSTFIVHAQTTLDVKVALANQDPIEIAMSKMGEEIVEHWSHQRDNLKLDIMTHDDGDHVVMKVTISEISQEGESTILAEPVFEQEWGKPTILHFENGDEIEIIATR